MDRKAAAVNGGRKTYTRFAQETDVPVEQTQREIEELVERYRADDFIRGRQGEAAIIAFRMNACTVKFVLPIPVIADFEKMPNRNAKRTPEAQRQAWELGKRQRWRALKLSIQAKLEAVAAGISTFEREFLPFIVLPGGQTVGDEIIPRLPETFGTGAPLLLAGGKP